MIKSTPLLKLFIVLILTLVNTSNIFSNQSKYGAIEHCDIYPLNQYNLSSSNQDDVIKYTLTDKDYAVVGNGGFSNFDIREGYDEETVTARLAKINKILLANFPNYKKGQKIEVSYNVWKPGDDVFVMKVIHDGTKYVLQQE